LSKKFVTSSQKLFACNDVRDTCSGGESGETSDDATFLVRSGIEVDCDKLALSGTKAIARTVHSENTSARNQSESSRETIVVRRMTAHVPVFSVRAVPGSKIARGFDDIRRWWRGMRAVAATALIVLAP
jgi:hypothetical protein